MIEKSRKQRLRDCEKVLAEHMEEFVRVGLSLKEIRDERLYKEDGFETWESYLKANKDRFGIGSRSYAHEVIESAALRMNLDVRHAEHSWNQRQIDELKRLKSTSKARHVAKRVLVQIEKEGAKLTAAVVRKHVDKELGVDRTKPKDKPKPEFEDKILQWTDEIESMAYKITTVPSNALALFARNHKAKAKALAAAIETLEKSLTRVWESLP